MKDRLQHYRAAQRYLRMARQRLDDERKQLGYVIRKTREKKGINAAELARMAEISPPFLYDLELGRRSVTDETLEKILEVLK